VPCRKAWSAERAQKPGQKAQAALISLRSRLSRPEKYLLHGARKRAKDKGLPFNLTVDDVRIPAVCPVLGVPLEPGSRQQKDRAPSLDRFIPALGYVRGNVRVISWRANSLKADGTIEEFERILAYMRGAP
jgi:hypothetical protein